LQKQSVRTRICFATGPPMVVRLQDETAAKLSKLPFRRPSPPIRLTGRDLRRPSSLFFFRRPECPDFAEPFPRVRLRRTAILCARVIFLRDCFASQSFLRPLSHCQRGGTAVHFMQPVSVAVSGNSYIYNLHCTLLLFTESIYVLEY